MVKPVEEKRAMVEVDHAHLSISRQCELVGLTRFVFYYQPAKADEENLKLMAEIRQAVSEVPLLWQPQNDPGAKGSGL
jgi:putative transposase